MGRRVILFIATSVDGYIADIDGNIDWLNSQTNIEEEDSSYEDLYGRIDTVIMGRNTYDQIIEELAVDNYPYEDKMSYIITSRLEEDTENKRFRDQDPAELVGLLKAEEGEDIWIVGGANIIKQLMEEDLIDEFRITNIPIILGDGIRLFDKMDNATKLRTSSVTLKNGMIMCKYKRR